jgi:hypothetical protein
LSFLAVFHFQKILDHLLYMSSVFADDQMRSAGIVFHVKILDIDGVCG